MSGIRSGTRLQRLEQTQRAARLQRAHARWQGDHLEHDRLDRLVTALQDAITDERAELDRAARTRPTIAAAVRTADQTVEERLRAMGVTTHEVKTWAVAQGLLPAVVRGRVAAAYVDAYAHAHAHQPQETTP